MAENKTVDLSEVSELIKKIKDGSTGHDIPLSEVLRLCMRLGKLLQNDELVKWSQSELNGYTSNDGLPDYREFGAQVMGHLSGPFGSGYRNIQVPQSVIDKKHRKMLFTNYMTEPVAELEELSSQGDKTDTLSSHWPADVIAFYQTKEIFSGGMVLASAWRVISKARLGGILDTIRTRVLEFVLSIEDELDIKGSKGKEEVEVSPPTDKKVTQNVHNIIYGGNVSVGNFGATTQNNIVVRPGDFDGLKKSLKELGVTDALITELEDALSKDEKSEEQPGPATTSWISRVMIMIGKGSISVANNTAGSMIASAIMQYLGMA